MSAGKVDVLDVLLGAEAMAVVFAHGANPAFAPRCAEAHAAVAELLEAARELMRVNRPIGMDMQRPDGSMGDAALAPEVLANPIYAAYSQARDALAKVQP